MSNNKKIFMILGGAVALTGVVLFFMKPKAKITLRKDGTGTIQLGRSSKEFKLGKGADLTSWNGYELHYLGEEIWLRKWGRNLLKADGTPDVEIVAV
jgi:hypothetical protein